MGAARHAEVGTARAGSRPSCSAALQQPEGQRRNGRAPVQSSRRPCRRPAPPRGLHSQRAAAREHQRRPFSGSGSSTERRRGERVELAGLGERQALPHPHQARRSGREVKALFTPPTAADAASASSRSDPGPERRRPRDHRVIDVYRSNPHGIPASASHHLVQQISQLQALLYENGEAAHVFPSCLARAPRRRRSGASRSTPRRPARARPRTPGALVPPRLRHPRVEPGVPARRPGAV